ncbi:PREDICTED: light-induced protein, chloroplastic-like [Ipomoea nil]|uniref:Chromoplast-specific carotenoid-associated protein n=1 Tax=Ipomoea nil TaxID=35883 RepID=A0A2Z5WH71_IPONI|nr:PREDICTED: light-induced protein, chloroplastic-like [Ipomoea nil]BBB93636.1 chromoplast-specific carotenoid-associated protein [Ipomoea nil]
MASISSFTQFHCKPVGMICPRSSSTPKPSVFPVNSTIFASKVAALRSFPNRGLANPNRKFVVRAVSDDEWGEEKKEPLSAAPAGVAVVEDEPAALTETDVLKKQLVDSFYGTNRGLSASSETRAEVVELITQLEAKNPTPAPTEALTLLNGKWVLAYTSFIGLFPLLSRGTLPLVRVEEICQTIDSESFTVQNSVVFSGPLATTSISTNAKFEVRSPKRVQIKFEEGIIGTPQLTDSIVLPENVEFLGQKIDLTPFKGLITSLQDTASSVVKSISSQPPLKFSLANSNAESWLLTTYLDSELRISRGEAGSIFVLIKEDSPLLKP